MSDKTFSNNIAPAAIRALIICVLRAFTIPWSIWKGATLRLSAQQAISNTTEQPTDSEFPVLEWFKNAWDGAIFLSWFVIPLFAFLTGAYYYGLGSGISALLGVLIPTYFLTILLSLFKESLILLLSIALNVEKLTQKP